MPRRPADPRIDLEEMARLYRLGYCLNAVARAAGIGVGRVGRMLRDAGVEIRQRGHRPGDSARYTAARLRPPKA